MKKSIYYILKGIFSSFFKLPHCTVGKYYKQIDGVYSLPDYVYGKRVEKWQLYKNNLWKPLFWKGKPLHRVNGRLYWKWSPVDDDDFSMDNEAIRDYNRYVRKLNKMIRRKNKIIRHRHWRG